MRPKPLRGLGVCDGEFGDFLPGRACEWYRATVAL